MKKEKYAYSSLKSRIQAEWKIYVLAFVFILIADSTRYGIGLLILAFLVSPYGLPMLAAWLVGKLHGLRYAIQDWLY